jgi:hypothetical protein
MGVGPMSDTGGIAEREVRSARMVLGQMSSPRLGMQKIVLRNTSGLGLGAVAKGNPPLVGEEVTIHLQSGAQVRGTVRWVRNDRFGVLLESPADPAWFIFSGTDWEQVSARFDRGHVYDHFKPVERAWRPPVRSLS